MRLSLPQGPLLFDLPIPVTVEGCEPMATVTLRAFMQDDQGLRWQSWAHFVAPSEGRVDTATQAPIQASYFGVDPAGLLWSMEPPEVARPFLRTSRDPLTLWVEASSPRCETVSQSVERRVQSPEVGARAAPDGILLHPGRPARGVLLMGARGLPQDGAALLASHGFSVLAATPGPGPVEVEWVERQVQWMISQPEVAPLRVALCGTGRTGELALLAATRMSGVGPVIGCSASGLTFQAADGPAWTYRGSPLEGIPLPPPAPQPAPVKGRKRFEQAVLDRQARERGRIPVERIEADILLLSGQADGVWPASAFSEVVCQRLRRLGQEFEARHLTYPNAGHLLGPEFGYPHRPTGCLLHPGPFYAPDPAGPVHDLGGRPAFQARAQRESWAALLDLLKDRSSLC